jgi:hypothetical protein
VVSFCYRYRVERKSSHSKYFVVVKCLVTPSDNERDGHFSPLETVSIPLNQEHAYAFCERLNQEEKKKETSESR